MSDAYRIRLIAEADLRLDEFFEEVSYPMPKSAGLAEAAESIRQWTEQHCGAASFLEDWELHAAAVTIAVVAPNGDEQVVQVRPRKGRRKP